MKVGVITNAFCERDMIVGCIEQFSRHSQNWHHQVLVSKKPWHGDWSADDTHVVAANHGASVEVGMWQNASEQLNHGLDIFSKFDWVVICDADERYTQQGLDELWETMLLYRHQKDVKAMRTDTWSVYWRTPYFKISPEQEDFPLICIRPSERFGHIRSFAGQVQWVDTHMYHLSYVRTNKEMLKKIESFDASAEFDPQKWYNSVWLPWTPESRNLHPVVPEQFAGTECEIVPEELWDLIPRKYWVPNDKTRTATNP